MNILTMRKELKKKKVNDVIKWNDNKLIIYHIFVLLENF